MSLNGQKIAIEQIAESIEIPEGAYEQAKKRYEDLGAWFSRPESVCSRFSPHLYPQGSFRLDTVTKPADPKSSYDLDMGCRLREGLSKGDVSQKDLKEMVRHDLEQYRVQRNIKELLEEKHRCWCLNYADNLSFHMDVVPSLPEEIEIRKSLKASMIQRGEAEALADSVALHAGAITDNQLWNYDIISDHWHVSNSEGYAVWFESRTRLAGRLIEKAVERKATIEALPTRKGRLPLQRCVQILKRHRDLMFKANPDAKPSSIILTTLAATAYQGEVDISEGLRNILSKMGQLVGTVHPRIPNPINPAEDFADRWHSPKGQRLQLEVNFTRWLERAQGDFGALESEEDADYLVRKSLNSFGADLNPVKIERLLEAGSGKRSFAIGGVASATPKSPVDYWGDGRFG